MNGLGKPFRKKIQSKKWKNSENQCNIAVCEQKSTIEKKNTINLSDAINYFTIKRL